MTTSSEPSSPAQRTKVEESEFRRDLLALAPFLRAFARTLSGHRDMADDLCQEALAKAWQSRGSYEMGTNLKAWLFMILRNQFYSEKRRSWRTQPLLDSDAEAFNPRLDHQGAILDLTDLNRALQLLTPEQREALILVGAGGFSYQEASSICACPLGTIKSRLARARTALQQILDGTGEQRLERRTHQNDAMEEIMTELDRLTLRPPDPAR